MSESRTSTRHTVTLDITIEIGDQRHEAKTQNLSLGGVGVALEQRLAMGTKVQLRFRLPTTAEPIEVAGEVRWCTDTSTGIQFGGLRARDVWELNRYFDSLPSR